MHQRNVGSTCQTLSCVQTTLHVTSLVRSYIALQVIDELQDGVLLEAKNECAGISDNLATIQGSQPRTHVASVYHFSLCNSHAASDTAASETSARFRSIALRKVVDVHTQHLKVGSAHTRIYASALLTLMPCGT